MIKDIIHVFKTNKYAKIAIVVAILMPAIFGGIFLGSMWDPYGNSKNMPVAVVNYDKSVEFKGKYTGYRSQIGRSIKDNDSLDFQIPTKKKAEEGLEKVITI